MVLFPLLQSLNSNIIIIFYHFKPVVLAKLMPYWNLFLLVSFSNFALNSTLFIPTRTSISNSKMFYVVPVYKACILLNVFIPIDVGFRVIHKCKRSLSNKSLCIYELKAHLFSYIIKTFKFVIVEKASFNRYIPTTC